MQYITQAATAAEASLLHAHRLRVTLASESVDAFNASRCNTRVLTNASQLQQSLHAPEQPLCRLYS
jgi:hypothetical protein